MFLKKTILFVFVLCSFKGYALSNEHVILELPDQNKQNYRSVHSKMPKKDTVEIVERVKSNIEKFVHKHYRVIILSSMGLVIVVGSAIISSCEFFKRKKSICAQLDELHKNVGILEKELANIQSQRNAQWEYEANRKPREDEQKAEIIAQTKELNLMQKIEDMSNAIDYWDRRMQTLGPGHLPGINLTYGDGRPYLLEAAHLKEDSALRKSKKARIN